MAKLKAIKNRVIDEGSDDPDFLLCLQYVKHVELEGNTKESFSEFIGKDRSTIWQWQIKWTHSGLLEKVRLYLGSVLSEDITIAQRKVLRNWGGYSDELHKIITTSDSDYVKLQAIIFVHDKILVPFMEAQEDSAAPARAFLQAVEGNAKVLDPLSVARDDAPADDEYALQDATDAAEH